MKLRRTLIAIGAAAALSLLVAAPAAATFPGANGRIAFTHQSADGHGAIATINPDGSDLRQLGPGGSPAWSADGRRIVYGYKGDIYVMRADGSNKRQITFTPRAELDPSFSPGGGRITYWQNGTRFSALARLMTMRSDGSDQHTLVGQGHGSSPEWAPNGKHIAYIAIAPGGEPNGPAIWTMRPDGSHRRSVYATGPGPPFHGLFGPPHYAPDSRSIVFTQADPEVIMKVGAFGNNPHKVNSEPINLAGSQISPDGSCLLGMVGPPSNVFAKGSQCPTAGWLTNDRQPVYAYELSWQPLP